MMFEELNKFKYDNYDAETCEEYLKRNDINFKYIGEGGYSLIFNIDKYAIKLIPITENDEDSVINEVYFIELLNEKILETNLSPHILKYYQYIEFSDIPYMFRNDIFFNFIRNYQSISKCILIITDFCEYGSLDQFKVKSDELMIIFFQVIYTLYQLQKEIPGYRFGDLGFTNIFVSKDNNYHPNKFYLYKVNNKEYLIPSMPFQIKFGDFGSNKILSEGKYNTDIQDFIREDFSKITNPQFRKFIDDLKHNPHVTPLEILNNNVIRSKFVRGRVNNTNIISTFNN